MADDLKPPVALYDTDFVAWTEAQAEALRCARPAGLDWDHIAEEIEDLGKSDQRACESLLEQIILHLLKIDLGVDPNSERHWRSEVRAFRRSLARRITPTIERRIRPTLPQVIDQALADLTEDAIVEPGSAPASTYSWDDVTSEGRFPPFG
jgi:hypothetical protein